MKLLNIFASVIYAFKGRFLEKQIRFAFPHVVTIVGTKTKQNKTKIILKMNLKNRPILGVPLLSNSVHIIVPPFIQQSTKYRLKII